MGEAVGAVPFSLELPRRIWWPWEQNPQSVGFWVRFEVGQAAAGQWAAACSGDYQAWLDGVPIPQAQGQLPSWRSMHRAAVALAPGGHWLCVEARPGPNTQSFFLSSLDWPLAGEAESKMARLASGSAWRMAADPPPGWQERFSGKPGGQEDGLASRPAWAFDGPWAEPWGLPCNAPPDYCRMGSGWQEVHAEALMRLAGVFPGAAALGAKVEVHASGATAFWPAQPYPIALPPIGTARPRLEWYRTREAHSLVNNTWLDLFEARCAHVVFDVGAETFARVRLRLESGGPAVVALTSGESLPEVQRYARRVTDLCELADGQEFTTAPTGFRYLKVMVLSAGDAPVRLAPLQVEHVRYPARPQGRFRCSDAGLNAIFELSQRTVHLCMQNEIWDGIKRDQLAWMGDLYTEALAVYHLFGDTRLARRSLAVLAEIGPAAAPPLERQRYPGLTAIWKLPGGDINNIPSYTLWWLAGMADYYRYSGDVSLIQETAREIEETLQHIRSWVGEDGLWRLQGGWDFVDWAPLSEAERATYCHLLATRVMGLGAELLEAAGRSGEAYRATQERMRLAARRNWWQAGVGGFGVSHHVNAQAVCSGVLAPQEAGALFDQMLRPDPPLSMTYWHRFLDLMAAQEVGEVGWGLEMIRKYWGQQVQLGVTALWEAFDAAWLGEDPHALSLVGAGYARYGGYETSLCHGWSAGPAAWLHTAVLGVRPAAAGFRTFTFRPDLGDLDWAEGEIPTPHGTIHVALSRAQDGSLVSEVQAPPGIERVGA